MRKPWIWFLFSALWLALAFAAMFFMTRPTPVKAEPVGSIKAALIRPTSVDWFSATPAGVLLINGQDPVDPEEGNPSHLPPAHECAMNPKAGSSMVRCSCTKYQVCDSGQEPRQCKSYCYKSSCKCPHPCE